MENLIRSPDSTDRFAAGPFGFCRESGNAMDAFSEILGRVTLKGALFFSAEFSAPWGFSSPPSGNLAPMLAPGAPHPVIFHLLIEGSGLVRLEDGSVLRLEGGDVIVLPHGDVVREINHDRIGTRSDQCSIPNSHPREAHKSELLLG